MPFQRGKSGNKAGRPKGAINKDKREFNEILEKHGGIEERIEKLRELANGVLCIKKENDGSTVIYEKPPDTTANVYLVDRVLGKPRQAIDMTGSVEVTWEDMFGIKPVDSKGED